MKTEVFSPADLDRAQSIWDEYQRTHDVSGWNEQAVGVDPHTGEVFFGRTSGDILDRLRSDGRWRPLAFWRVGRPYYARERGTRRCSPGL